MSAKKTEPATPEAAVVQEQARDSQGKVKFESRLLTEEAVAYFEAIVEGLRKRQLSLSHKDTCLQMQLGSWLDVKVKASIKGTRQRLDFGLEWERNEDEGLTISSGSGPQNAS